MVDRTKLLVSNIIMQFTPGLKHFSCSYALPSAKAQAVAQETLVIWCSLASRLGLWALKAELEDLCFAVLQVGSKCSFFLFFWVILFDKLVDSLFYCSSFRTFKHMVEAKFITLFIIG